MTIRGRKVRTAHLERTAVDLQINIRGLSLARMTAVYGAAKKSYDSPRTHDRKNGCRAGRDGWQLQQGWTRDLATGWACKNQRSVSKEFDIFDKSFDCKFEMN